jgi:hypothetical protein
MAVPYASGGFIILLLITLHKRKAQVWGRHIVQFRAQTFQPPNRKTTGEASRFVCD